MLVVRYITKWELGNESEVEVYIGVYAKPSHNITTLTQEGHTHTHTPLQYQYFLRFHLFTQ
jgi:hypothetical protein